jgi:hypothetical protein
MIRKFSLIALVFLMIPLISSAAYSSRSYNVGSYPREDVVVASPTHSSSTSSTSSSSSGSSDGGGSRYCTQNSDCPDQNYCSENICREAICEINPDSKVC